VLSAEEQQRLLRFARRCLDAHVRREPLPPAEHGGMLDLRTGAFVSLHERGDLRGCLGHIEPDRPLGEIVGHLAAVVSDSDPRFQPVTVDELDDVDVEISVLTLEREIVDVNEIEVGRHGLIIEMGSRRGLLLPQVATEFGWNRETFLEYTCLKAGLPRDTWRHGARILIFEAQVFGERH
jgi:AmmeMemoRadiSam system protein A